MDDTSYLRYTPHGGSALIKHSHYEFVYRPGDYAIWFVTPYFFMGYRWEVVDSFDNRQGSADRTFSKKISTQTTNKSGSEWNIGGSVGGSFKGVELKIEGGYKRFKSTETVNFYEETRQWTVAKGHREILYQKVYEFKTRTHMAYDAWGDKWILCNRWSPRKSYTRVYVWGDVDIHADEFTVKNTHLTGNVSMRVDSINEGSQFLYANSLRGREAILAAAHRAAIGVGWSPWYVYNGGYYQGMSSLSGSSKLLEQGSAKDAGEADSLPAEEQDKAGSVLDEETLPLPKPSDEPHDDVISQDEVDKWVRDQGIKVA